MSLLCASYDRQAPWAGRLASTMRRFPGLRFRSRSIPSRNINVADAHVAMHASRQVSYLSPAGFNGELAEPR